MNVTIPIASALNTIGIPKMWGACAIKSGTFAADR